MGKTGVIQQQLVGYHRVALAFHLQFSPANIEGYNKILNVWHLAACRCNVWDRSVNDSFRDDDQAFL